MCSVWRRSSPRTLITLPNSSLDHPLAGLSPKLCTAYNPLRETAGSRCLDRLTSSWRHATAGCYNGDPALRVAGYPTGVEDEQTDSGAVAPFLLPACPNPFNPRTNIRFSLARKGTAQLAIHDIAGRRVATLLDTHLTAGEHNLEWDGRGSGDEKLASGVYFIRLTANGTRQSCRVTLLK